MRRCCSGFSRSTEDSRLLGDAGDGVAVSEACCLKAVVLLFSANLAMEAAWARSDRECVVDMDEVDVFVVVFRVALVEVEGSIGSVPRSIKRPGPADAEEVAADDDVEPEYLLIEEDLKDTVVKAVVRMQIEQNPLYSVASIWLVINLFFQT